MDTTTNNKLIAEFIGYKIQKDPTERFFGRYKTPITNVWIKENELSFDTDWDWLMPVVFKCLEICHNEMLDEWEAMFSDSFFSRDINCMYSKVVRFIEWFNKQNLKL